MSDVLILHNPRCSKSRAALALLRERGVEPRIVDYLREPPDAELIAAAIAHPHLIQRPLVVSGARAAIGRPPEAVLGLL